MKGFLHLPVIEEDWVKKLFPRYEVYTLPFLGKPLVEFYLDYCILCGIKDVTVMVEEVYGEEIIRFLGDGNRWGVNITCKDDLGKKEDIAKSLGGVEVLFLEGVFFPLYNRNVPLEEWSPLPDSCAPYARVIGGKEMRVAPLTVRLFDGILSYYQLNMELMRNHIEQLFIRGYGHGKNIFVGMDCLLSRHAQLKGPFVIGNGVQILGNSQIGENAIIGDGCIVDKGTIVRDTVVLDGTFIGKELDICRKVVWRSWIIDPESGVMMENEGCFFCREVDESMVREFILRWLARIPAVIMLCVLGPLYLLFQKLGWMPKANLIHYRTRRNVLSSRTLVRFMRNERAEWREKLFFHLSLDKVLLLWMSAMRLI